MGPFQLPAPWTQDTWTEPSLATLNTSVWLGMPNWLEATTASGVGATGTTALDAADGGPVPTLFVAVTVKV